MADVELRLDRMTSREVEAYLKRGGDLALIPFGPVSGHGAFIPMGIHAHWAEAISTLVARRANGVVYPPVFTVYSGATRSFRGAVSFPMVEQAAILARVAKTLYAAGFKRTVLVAGTTPENYGGIVTARALFDETDVPFWMLECERLLGIPEVARIYEGYPGNFGETLIGLASLRILGLERPIPCPSWARERKEDDGEGDQPAEIHGDVSALRRLGMVGWRYHEEREHGNHGTAGITWKGRSDLDMAVEVLEKCADSVLPALESLDRYRRWLESRPFKYIEAKERLGEPM